MSDKPKETVIAEETEVDGTITSTCGISLSGRVKGDVCAPSLRVQPTGTVDGRVEVADLHSEGQISGQIKAEHVQLSGRVSDKTVIRAKTLEVRLTEQGQGVQVTFGDCELQIGDAAARAGVESDKTAATQAKPKPAEQGSMKVKGL